MLRHNVAKYSINTIFINKKKMNLRKLCIFHSYVHTEGNENVHTQKTLYTKNWK